MQNTNQSITDSFYSCLLDQITQEDDSASRVCLITGAILEEPIVELDCGHAFNYKPLLEEVRNQKDSGLNSLEVQKLRTHQMKCPYCRTIHDMLLPSLEGEEKIPGVNWPRKYAMFLHKCSYKLRSGKRKGLLCERQCNETVCPMHKKSTEFLHECVYKLKSGKRKGLPCDRPCKTSMCLMHKDIVGCSALLLSGKRKGSKCLRKAGNGGLCHLHQNKNEEP